jgi:hypothetical protein
MTKLAKPKRTVVYTLEIDDDVDFTTFRRALSSLASDFNIDSITE